MELTQREHALKDHTRKLMKKYGKTIYRHNGVEITVTPGEDDVRVKVRKHDEDDAAPRAAAADDQEETGGDDVQDDPDSSVEFADSPDTGE
jgi:hypothetical protein